MRSPLALVSLSIASLVALAPALALATPLFPSAVQGDLSLSFTPPCTICHQGIAGNGTATTAFAEAMKTRGLVPGDETTLAAALTQMTTDMVDSDMNGTIDTEQIKEGCDPSTDTSINPGATCGGGSSGDMGPSAGYGCGAQLAAGPATWPGAAALAALGLAALARRRRRASR